MTHRLSNLATADTCSAQSLRRNDRSAQPSIEVHREERSELVLLVLLHAALQALEVEVVLLELAPLERLAGHLGLEVLLLLGPLLALEVDLVLLLALLLLGPLSLAAGLHGAACVSPASVQM